MDVLHAHLQKGNSACMKRPNVCGFLKKKKLQGVMKGEQSETEKKINTCRVTVK